MGKIMNFLLAKPNISVETKRLEASNMQYAHNKHLETMNSEVLFEEVQKIRALLLSQEKTESYGYTGLDYAIKVLKHNVFPHTFINEYLSYMEKNYTIEKLRDTNVMKNALKEYLLDKILIYESPKNRGSQKIVILVGASGVGKTSAVLTMAANLDFENAAHKTKKQIRIASLDNHNIVAKEHLDKFSEYIAVEGEVFRTPDDFFQYMQKGTRPEILLVDTMGKSPKNKTDIVKMAHSLSSVLEKGEVFVVIPANASEGDIRYMLREFSLLHYDGVIISKVDETGYPATALGVCMQEKVPIAYISKGKDIGDFSRVNKDDLLKYIKITI